MKKEKTIIGLMGPMRPIRPMRLMRLMGLIGLIGLMSACSSDSDIELEPVVPSQGKIIPQVACLVTPYEEDGTTKANWAYEANEPIGFSVSLVLFARRCRRLRGST